MFEDTGKWSRWWYEYSPKEFEKMSEVEQVDFLTTFSFQDAEDYLEQYELQHAGHTDDLLVEFEGGEVGKNKKASYDYRDTYGYNGTTSNEQSNTHLSHGWGGSQGALWNKKQCPTHYGTDVMAEWEGRQLAGAQGSEITIDPNLKLVIDLAGLFQPGAPKDAIRFTPGKGKSRSAWSKAMSSLDAQVEAPPILRIQNPDMGTPPVSWKFWQDLFLLLPEGRTVVCCMGGHGRTGTVLACLM